MKNKTQKTTFVKGLKSKLQRYARGEKLRTVQEDGDNEGPVNNMDKSSTLREIALQHHGPVHSQHLQRKE